MNMISSLPRSRPSSRAWMSSSPLRLRNQKCAAGRRAHFRRVLQDDRLYAKLNEAFYLAHETQVSTPSISVGRDSNSN